ncbi:MAG: hypothetical protein WC775_03900 [Patescibacteria group bacterium]|jgi:protein involved in polysaccharide export with SLBB domain
MLNLLAQIDIGNSNIFAPAARFNSLGSTATTVGKAVALAGGLSVFAGFVYAAYLYLTANGEAKKIQEAQQILTYGIIGLVLIGAAFWIMQIIGKLINY